MGLFDKSTGKQLFYGARVETSFGRKGYLIHFNPKTEKCLVRFDDEIHPDPNGVYPIAINAEYR
jgi:hypothetical protein